jgi:HK97 gp10 family phage protein
MKIKYRVEGLQESIAAFEELSKATSKNVVGRALTKSLEPIRETAERLASRHSARLGRSIVISATLKKSQRKDHKKRSPTERFVGSNSPVAHLIEFGTTLRTRESGGSTGFVPPRSFMRAAVDATLQRSIDLFNIELKTEIDKAAARQRAKAARRIAQIKAGK